MNEQIDWSKAPEGATHYFPPTEEWYMAGNGWAPLVWTGMWCKAFQFSERKHKCVQRPTTPSWSGEGLPPVGVVCEVAPDNSLWGFSTLEIRKCLVIAYHDDFVWLDTFVPGIPVATRVDKVTFRPIRTPEQIAADERDAAIKEIGDMIASVGPTFRDQAARLYDAGYRKP